MLYVYTLFDERRDSYPLMSAIYDGELSKLEFFTFYLPGTKKSIYDIEATCDRFSKIISNNNVMLNDFKQHCVAFAPKPNCKVFDVDLPTFTPKDIKSCRKNIATIINKMKLIKPRYWHLVRAMASEVYGHLQTRGAMYSYQLRHSIWGRVYSGRSKTSGFNIQGLGECYLSNINGDDILINFDWIAADMRAIAIMSGDKKLNMSFDESDPYIVLLNHLNSGVQNDKLRRDEAKRLMFSSIYSFDDDNPALDFYNGFRSWIQVCRNRLREDKYLKSILGRRFYVGRGRTERSAFNAMVQGSVANAMQICIRKVWELFPDSILTENHDSLVVTSKKSDLAFKLHEVAKIMTQPFCGIIKSNPQFPIKISIGRKYKGWKEYKRYDNCGQVK